MYLTFQTIKCACNLVYWLLFSQTNNRAQGRRTVELKFYLKILRTNFIKKNNWQIIMKKREDCY